LIHNESSGIGNLTLQANPALASVAIVASRGLSR
jgi:hypothetical protein